MKSLILTGFMGAGKSSVARILSQTLGLDLIDLDREIEAHAGMTIAEIFESQGETRFRTIETECLERAISKGGVVIATGGGVLTTPINVMIMSGAIVVNLDANIETLLHRVRGSEGRRPLLRGGEHRVRELFAERRPLYGAVTLQVDTEGLSALEVASRVSALYLEQGGEVDDQG